MIRIVGYIILIISLILWCIILIIPWLDLTKSRIVGITATLIIVAEVLFYLSIIILGKSIINKLKNKFKFWKKRPDEENVQETKE